MERHVVYDGGWVDGNVDWMGGKLPVGYFTAMDRKAREAGMVKCDLCGAKVEAGNEPRLCGECFVTVKAAEQLANSFTMVVGDPLYGVKLTKARALKVSAKLAELQKAVKAVLLRRK